MFSHCALPDFHPSPVWCFILQPELALLMSEGMSPAWCCLIFTKQILNAKDFSFIMLEWTKKKKKTLESTS